MKLMGRHAETIAVASLRARKGGTLQFPRRQDKRILQESAGCDRTPGAIR
jgi:hypothetical protein